MSNLTAQDKKLSKKSFFGKRIVAYFVFLALLVILAFLGYIGYLAYLSPLEKLKVLDETFYPKPHPDGISDYRLDAGLFSIKKEEAFLGSKVAMLATDSIYMSINLKDSTIGIEIQGVAMNKVKITGITKSGIFDAMNGIALIHQFSTPFKIDSMFATIPKDPFILKIAPADTIEAQKDVTIPDTLRSEPVIFSAFLNKGIVLNIIQSEEDESRSVKKYLMKKRYDRLMNFLMIAKDFNVPEYQPYITLSLPAKDARAIYRALPAKALIAIRLP